MSPSGDRVPETSRLEVHSQSPLGIGNWWTHKVCSRTHFVSHYYYFSYVAYLLLAIGCAACCVWYTERTSKLTFGEALYLSVSVATMTGMTSWDFTKTNISTQVVVWLHMIACSPMLMSIAPLILRQRSFRKQARYEQRLGRSGTWKCAEYNALAWLRYAVLRYWIGCQLVGWLFLWFLLCFRGGHQGTLIDSCWPALFLATSSFHNCGLSTLQAGLPFAKDFAGLTFSFLAAISALILAGNSCFPIFLHGLLRLLRRQRNRSDPALELLLKDPRRCYTHLFPGYATRWLAIVTVGLILSEAVALLVADWRMWHNFRPDLAFDALIFHSISSRTGGISVIDLSTISPASCFVFSVCMWISISPVVVATRSTMKSSASGSHASLTSCEGGLLPYDLSGAHLEVAVDPTAIKTQLSVFMSQNLVVLAVLFFVILVSEESRFSRTHFHWILFEFCSCWGTVGLSMSPKSYSFSGDWCGLAQGSLLVVMFLGRLRGLPHSIDPSVFVHMELEAEQPALDAGVVPSCSAS